MQASTGFSQQTVAQIAAGEPDWLRRQRQEAWQLFESLSWPTKRDVDWRHFDLRALGIDRLSLPADSDLSVAARLAPLPPAASRQGVIACDLREAVAQHTDLVRPWLERDRHTAGPTKFTALHHACWRAGAFVYVPRGVRVEAPLEIVYSFRGEDTAAFPRTVVVVEPGAEATVVQRFVGGPGGNGNPRAVGLHASATDVFVQEGGQLHYISLQNFDRGVYDFTSKCAQVEQDAEIDWVLGMFGADFMRYDVDCTMNQPGGTSFLYGAGVGQGRQQFGQFTRQHHRRGNTTSDLMFKNVYRDAAVGNYAGLIKVEKDANGTNAYQANRNLVLSDKVQCDTRPILEIESNQLRCTHGATVGRLDENQLFYLRARGLDTALARKVLIGAFLDPILARIRVEPVAEEFRRLIEQRTAAAVSV